MGADASGEGGGDAAMVKVELSVADLRLGIINGSPRRLQVGRALVDGLLRAEIVSLQFLSTPKLRLGELEPCRRALELGSSLGQPDLVGTGVDGEEEIALMDNVSILEVYSSKRAAHLSAELNLVDRGKLTKEAQSRIKLAHERLAHNHLPKWRRAGGGGSIAFTIRISQPSKTDGCDCCPHSNPQSGWRPSVRALDFASDPRPVRSFVQVSGCSPVGNFTHVVTHSDPGNRLLVTLKRVAPATAPARLECLPASI